MRKKIIAANWKMNLSYAEAMSLTDALVDASEDMLSAEIILAAPFVYLHALVGRIQSQPSFSIAAQNCASKEKGAFTGEVSASMLASIGVEHVIIGHSERRLIFNESDNIVAEKIKCALAFGLMPLFCCGEELQQRNAGNHFKRVEEQLNNGLFQTPQAMIGKCIIAYEPVWAIGTGVNATADQAREMHEFIRDKVRKKYDSNTADAISILYGGSVTASNSAELFNCPDVDGGLVGGASLKATEFLSIIDNMIHSNNFSN